MPWFGVRTLYRTRLVGRPRSPDSDYHPGYALIEERVVLFRAKSGSDAIAKAEREAKRYAANGSTNVYGQKLVVSYLGTATAYEMDRPPRNAEEIYSDTEIVSSTVTARSIVLRRCGKDDKALRYRLAAMFIDGGVYQGLKPHLPRAPRRQPARGRARQ